MVSEKKKRKIAFTGDLFLGGDIEKNQSDVDISDLLEGYNYTFANLECPITDSAPISNKSTLYTRPTALETLSSLSIDGVSLANNHIHDCGSEGIFDTIANLDKNDIEHTGAGKTTNHAAQPVWVTDETAVLAFCDYDQPYLSKVQVAQSNQPGVSPLDLDHILNRVDDLPDGTDVILYLHWGREHVWFPPPNDIKITKKLLDDERVRGIIGSHAHRPQGYIDYNGKRAYFCTGNFLFPNFTVKPKVQYCPPEESYSAKYVTRRYHPVDEVTYKKWLRKNRLSLLVEYDPNNKSFDHIFVYQDDHCPKLSKVSPIKSDILDLFIQNLGELYTSNKKLYRLAYELDKTSTSAIGNLLVLYFLLKQQGPVRFAKFIQHMLNCKRKGITTSEAALSWFSNE